MDYDLVNRSISLFTLGKQTASYSLADMNMQDNQIIVPLRKTIVSLGGRITNAVMDPDYREVSMALRPLLLFQRK
jgi:hypothetical protein